MHTRWLHVGGSGKSLSLCLWPSRGTRFPSPSPSQVRGLFIQRFAGDDGSKTDALRTVLTIVLGAGLLRAHSLSLHPSLFSRTLAHTHALTHLHLCPRCRHRFCLLLWYSVVIPPPPTIPVPSFKCVPPHLLCLVWQLVPPYVPYLDCWKARGSPGRPWTRCLPRLLTPAAATTGGDPTWLSLAPRGLLRPSVPLPSCDWCVLHPVIGVCSIL